MNNTAVIVLAVTAAVAVAVASFLWGVNHERDRSASSCDANHRGWEPILGFAAGREG